MTLDEWCKKECKQVYTWLKKEGIPISSYYSLLKGRDVKLCTALMIHRATNGEVTYMDMLSEKARKMVESKEKKKN